VHGLESWSFAGGPTVGEEFIEVFGWVGADGCQDVAEVAKGVEAEAFAGDGDGINRGGGSAAFVTATEEVILSADDDILDGTLGGVVVDG
jgi:hypothetical protein